MHGMRQKVKPFTQPVRMAFCFPVRASQRVKGSLKMHQAYISTRILPKSKLITTSGLSSWCKATSSTLQHGKFWSIDHQKSKSLIRLTSGCNLLSTLLWWHYGYASVLPIKWSHIPQLRYAGTLKMRLIHGMPQLSQGSGSCMSCQRR